MGLTLMDHIIIGIGDGDAALSLPVQQAEQKVVLVLVDRVHVQVGARRHLMLQK